MAIADVLYEDVYNIAFEEAGAGETSGYEGGCKSVKVEFGADEIPHSSCDSHAVDYRGVTKKFVTVTIEFEGADLAREIGDLTFNGAIGEAMSAEVSEVGEERMHSGDGDCWVTHITVQKRSVEAKITARAIDQVDEHFEVGEVGTLTLEYATGSVDQGCPDGVITMTMPTMMVTGGELVATHNEYAEGTLEFKGTAGVKDVDGATSVTTDVHVGDPPGKLFFTVANAAGGAPKAYSVDNLVVTSKRMSFGHGGMVKETIVAKAYSTDGATSPFSDG